MSSLPVDFSTALEVTGTTLEVSGTTLEVSGTTLEVTGTALELTKIKPKYEAVVTSSAVEK